MDETDPFEIENLDLGDDYGESGDEFPDMPLTKSQIKTPDKLKKKVKIANPKPKAKRGPGRPKKQRQPTAPGGKGFQEPLSQPEFEEDPTPDNRDLHTEDLLNQFDKPEDEGPPMTREEEISEAISYYEELWEKYPHLKLVPTLSHKEFTSESNMEDIEREIERVERLGTKPFRDKMFTSAWYMMVVAVTKVLAVSPLGDVLEPEPSAENPMPVKLSRELMRSDVTEQVKPAIEGIFEMYPLLEYLGNLGDPRIQLAYTISSCILTTYRANSEKLAANSNHP